MVKIINVPQNVVNDIQRKDVEMCSRRDIITFMLSKNMDISTERFNQYQEDYTSAYLSFESAKSDLEAKFIDPNMNSNEKKMSWDLNYHTNALTIVYEEA